MSIITKVREAIFPQAQNDVDLVPANTTWSQILDYVNGTGDDWAFDVYSVGVRGLRNTGLHYSTLSRCVTLLTSVMAQVITQGSIRVLDQDGKIVRTGRVKDIERMFMTSFDDMTDAYQWMEDWCAEYLLDGNCVAEVSRSARGQVRSLKALTSWDAQTESTSDGMDYVYRARYADNAYSDMMMFARPNVVHARWPRLQRRAQGNTSRQRFAQAPVIVMRPALQIGIESDKFLNEWYKSGGAHRAQLAISLRERMGPEQGEQIRTALAQQRNSRLPIVMGGGAVFTPLASSASKTEQTDMRTFQVDEVARVYGVPGPVIGNNVTQWGSGIEQLTKLLWRYGARQHVERLLSPLSYAMLRPGERFDVDEVDLMRGDAQGIAAMLTATGGDAQRGEVATTEERRRWAGLPVEPEYGTLKGPTVMRSESEENFGEDDNEDQEQDSGASTQATA